MPESHIDREAIERVLAGDAHYDDLNSREQAAVRAEWDKRTEQRRRNLDLAARFDAEGRPHVGLDDQGRPIRHQPQPRPSRPGAG